MYGGGYGSRFFTTVGDLWAAEWAAPETAPGVAPVAQHAHIRPNPSFGQAAIEFTLTSGATVQASIYDMAGRLVRRLEGGPRAAGPVSLGWDGRDGHGVRAPAGVYAVRLDVAGTLTNQKIVLLR
jgi:flagellar hook assembly protein FlgD